jgi:hypothetical protein
MNRTFSTRLEFDHLESAMIGALGAGMMLEAGA